MTKENGPKRVLTAAQAASAIYIDFEGRKAEAPAVLGILYAESRRRPSNRVVLRHEILAPELRALVDAPPIVDERLFRHDVAGRSLSTALADVLRRARNQGRMIVSWSRHEKSKVEEAGLSAAAQEEFDHRYVDGKVTAKHWLKQARPDVKLPFGADGGAHKLARYLELVGYDLPSTYGSGEVGTWLGQTRESLERRRCWESLTAVQQRRWRHLLEHNMHDLLGMREVLLHASRS